MKLLIIITLLLLVAGCVTESDDVIPCRTNWRCTDWSQCLNGLQNRSCIDLSNCGTNEGKPAEIQSCTVIEPVKMASCLKISNQALKANCLALETKNFTLCLSLSSNEADSCIFNFIKLNSIYNSSFTAIESDCNNINNDTLRIECKALAGRDKTLCDRLPSISSISNPSYKNNCYRNLAFVTKDYTYCYNSTDYRVNDTIIINNCIEFIAYLRTNSSLCNQINITISENETNTALTLKEIQICKDKITSSQYSISYVDTYDKYNDALCKAKFERIVLGNGTYNRQLLGYSPFNCVLRIAGAVKDERICNSSLLDSTYYNHCRAIATGNISYCFLTINAESCIKDSASLRGEPDLCFESLDYESCMNQVARRGIPSSCPGFNTELLRNACYYESGINELNTTYCEKITNNQGLIDECIYNAIRKIHLNKDDYFWVRGY